MVTLTVEFKTASEENAVRVGKDIVKKIPEIRGFVISEQGVPGDKND